MSSSFDGFFADVQAQIAPTSLAEAARLGRLVGNAAPQPQTRAMLSHGYTLRTANGTVIGGVEQVETSAGRDVQVRRQIGPNEHGRVVRQSARGADGQTLGITRIDIWAEPFTRVFGTCSLSGVISVLSDQASALALREAFSSPQLLIGRGSAVYQYTDVWFTRVSSTRNAASDRVIRVNAAANFGGRIQIA